MNKKRFLPLFLILALFITLGFAALRTNLQINGTANFKGNNWNIYFDNVQIKSGSVTPVTAPTIPVDNKTSLSFAVNLDVPGDYFEFTVDVVNDGSIDAMVETITQSNLTIDQSKIAEFKVTYSNGAQIKPNDILRQGTRETYKVSVKYKNGTNAEDLSTNESIVPLTVDAVYIQADNNAKEIDDAPTWTPVTGDGTNVGDEIAIGDEHFYVISNDGTTINALAKYNLNAGNMCANSSSILCTPIANPTYKQDAEMRGYVSGESVRKGTLKFSNTNGWPYSNNDTIDIQAYDGPVKTAINAYKEILPEGIEVRLITKSELEGLGCSSGSYFCSSAPSWVYSTSYWSGSASAYNGNNVWYVVSDGAFSYAYNNGLSYGVRPVISFEI